MAAQDSPLTARVANSDEVQYGAHELRMSHAMQDFLGRAGLRVWAWTPARETAAEFVLGQSWRPCLGPVRLHDRHAQACARWLERIAVTGRATPDTFELPLDDFTKKVRMSAEFSLEQIVGVSTAQSKLPSRVMPAFWSNS